MTKLRALYANRWVRYSLTVALLAIVLYKVNLRQILSAAGATRPAYLLAALVLTIPFLYCKALRWYLMLRGAGVKTTFSESAFSLIGGMGLALITPARLGELVRAAYLRDPQKLKIGGLVLIDKGFDVLALTTLSVAGAWILLGRWVGVALALVSIAGGIVVLKPQPLVRSLRSLGTGMSSTVKVQRGVDSLASLSTRASLIYGALTFLSFAIVLVQFGIILLDWHTWSFEIVFFTFPLVVLTNVLPVTIGGLGVREAAAAGLLSHYGVPASHAVLAAFLMFAVNTAVPGIIGALTLPLISGSSAAARSTELR